MKKNKYDWDMINTFCLENKPTRKEVCDYFGIKKYIVDSAIHRGYIDRKHIKAALPQTKEIKERISNALKLAHKEGRHPGWTFINKDINRRSYPEKVFFKYISMNEYFKQYEIIEKLPFGKYFLDFALIEKKIDIEIDGQQHILTEEAILHDKERDTFLNNNGWSVYRISWKSMQKDIIKEITLLIEFIEKLNESTNRVYTLDEIKADYKPQKNICECGKEKCKNAFTCQECFRKSTRKFKLTKQQLLEYILKYPVSHISKILKISDIIIYKKAKEFGIQTFPRGYWTKRFYEK